MAVVELKVFAKRIILTYLTEYKLLVNTVKIKEGFVSARSPLGFGKGPINFSPSRIRLSQFKHTSCT